MNAKYLFTDIFICLIIDFTITRTMGTEMSSWENVVCLTTSPIKNTYPTRCYHMVLQKIVWEN